MIRSRHSTGDLPAQFHASSITDDGGIARRVNPLARGILASPCKRRPDTGRPCPLLEMDKDNDYCGACRLMYGGAGPDEAEAMAFADMVLSMGRGRRARMSAKKNRYPRELPPRGQVCAVAWCNRPPAGPRSPFCRQCRSRIMSRVRRWYRRSLDGGDPPPDYLYAERHQGKRADGSVE